MLALRFCKHSVQVKKRCSVFPGSVPTNWLGNVPTPEKDPVVAEKPSQRSLAPVSSRNITLEIISPSRSGSVASSDPMTSPPPESKHLSLTDGQNRSARPTGGAGPNTAFINRKVKVPRSSFKQTAVTMTTTPT